MKNLKNSIFFLSVLALVSCGSSSQENQEESQTISEATVSETPDLKGMMQVELDDYMINASIYIPDESKGKAKISQNTYGGVEILVGDRYGLEVVPFGLSIEEKKSELEGDLVYTVEYIEESDNYFLYKKSIAESEIEPSYHFFMNVDADGDIFEIKSIDKEFSKSAAEKMLESAKTFEPKTSV